MEHTVKMFFMSSYPRSATAPRQSGFLKIRKGGLALVAVLSLILWMGACAPIGPAIRTRNTVTGVGYVGSAACRECHERDYAAWRDSLHAHMVRPIAKGDLTNVKADLTLPGAPRPDQYEWVCVIGGWYKEERYAYRDAQGNVVVGEIEYNRPLKRFILRKDQSGNPEAVDWLNTCGGCHATGLDYNVRQFSELNIGCEACHGPGAKHVAEPKVNKAAVDKTSEACGQCHIRGQDTSGRFRYPIDYQFNKPETLLAKFTPVPVTEAASMFPDQRTSSRHRQQYLDWKRSTHAPDGATCVGCHDPHVGALTYRTGMLRGEERALCGKCHAAAVADPVSCSGHRYEQASCAACHLPKLIGSGSVSTHTFEAIPPEKTIKYGLDAQGRVRMPNSCTTYCHTTSDLESMDAQYNKLFKK